MDKIGPYQILKELGRGGMGVVYRGVDPVIGRHVAIKTLRPEDMGEASERASLGEKLVREARSAGMLSHPAIVTIYQAGQDGDILYIAMEFVDGANLADVVAQGRLNTETMLKILKQCAEALDYAHSKGVVHRDIKPGNLLLEPSGKVKIADFGIAKLNQAGVTKTTSSVGSPAYMSPEHVRAQSIDGRADQYSLGVVAHELITGRRPHDSEELTSLVFKVVFEPPDLTLLGEHAHGTALVPIFAKVLSKAADDRYVSCMDFYDALAGVLDESASSSGLKGGTISTPANASLAAKPLSHLATVAVSPTSGANAAKPMADAAAAVHPAGKNKGLMIGGGVALAIALAVGGYFLTLPKPPVVPTKDPGQQDAGDAKPTLPILIQQPECSRPEDASVANVHGTVGLLYEVSELGQVENVRVSKSLHPKLDDQAVACIKTWRFKPSMVNGKEVRSRLIGGEMAF